MQKFLIILISIITLIILIVVFRKQIKDFMYWLFNLVKDLLKSIFTTLSSNKEIKAFFDKHYKIRDFIKARFDLKSKYGFRLTIILAILA
ncbi:MAG: hypothetical protein QMB51_03285, partial [Patescibacteria group bacterium]